MAKLLYWECNCSHRKTNIQKHLKYMIIWIFYMNAFPELEFFEDDEFEQFHDVSSNVSGQSSYWSDQ